VSFVKNLCESLWKKIDEEIIDFRKLVRISAIRGKKTLLLLLFLCAFCGKKTIVPLSLF
jgi:hypothetical protein